MGEVLILKMVDGEELIAEVAEKIDDEGEKKWVLNNPRILVFTQEGLALLPFPPYIKKGPIRVRTDHIKYPLVPSDELKAKYQEISGAIITPPTNLVV